MAIVNLPGQDKGQEPRSTTIEDWGSLNTKAQRPAIQPNEFSWIENWMPIGHGNMRTLPAEGAPIYTATGGHTIINMVPYNLGAVTYVAVFLSDGSAVQVRTSDGATTTIGVAGTFYAGGDIPATSQYQSKYLLIGSTISTSAYWVWDGTALYGAGTIAPQVTIINGGSKYTSAPTVTAFSSGAGTGATFTATVSNGAVTTITPSAAGSGFAINDHIQLIISGGGSDTQARAHGTIDSTKGGIVQIDVTNGGSAYTNDVHITFSGGGGTGAAAVVSTATNGVIVSITVTSPGSGYTSAPTVTFVATGGTGATAVARVVRGQLTAITLDSGGTGYDGAPTVVITSPDDTSFPVIQATATALVSGGAVTSFTIVNPGAGYLTVGIDLEGGNDAANAIASLMPFGLQATSMETYNNSVWTAVGTKMSFSAPGSVSDFSTVAGGGSAPATDSFLRAKIVQLKQANGFLYRMADSSINVISNVQTSATGTTTFSNQNVDAQIGTAWRDSAVAFGRAIVFANPNGVYALYGGAAEKVSDSLDGLFAKASFNTGQSGVTPTAAVATIFGIRVYMLLFTTTDPYSKTLRNIVAMWDGQKWFCCSQLATLKLVAPAEINSILQTWATDGTRLYMAFQVQSDDLPKVFQTKLVAGSGYNIYKQANRGYFVAENNAAEAALINFAIDTDATNGPVTPITMTSDLVFLGAASAPITFVGAGGVAIDWNVGSLGVVGFSTSAYGRMLGWTVTTMASDLTMISLTMLERDYASYG